MLVFGQGSREYTVTCSPTSPAVIASACIRKRVHRLVIRVLYLFFPGSGPARVVSQG